MVCSRQPWTSHTWPSSSKLGIVHLSCAIKVTSRCGPPSPPMKLTTEYAKVRGDPTFPLNSSEDLIKAYPDWFEGYWSIPWNLPHYSLWCQSCGTCTQNVSNCYATPGAWETQWVHQLRYHHSSCRAYWLGPFTCLLMEGICKTTSLSQQKGS